MMPPTSVSSANVASVPQRSLFRYPGGKTWLVPQIRVWLQSQPSRPRVLVEPFGGGGTVALTAVAENLVGRAVLAELDPNVAAVWRVLIHGDAEALARRIERFQFNYDNVRAELDKQPRSDLGLAFQTILRNRAQRGGIMARRAGLMNLGERGNGLASRWYPDTLARRIRDITAYRDRLEFVPGDGLAVIKKYTNQTKAVLFADPPYTAGGKNAGSRLYKTSALDHDRLFQLAQRFRGDILLTYDDSAEVRNLAAKNDFVVRPITMRSTHHSKMQELLIGRDLSWVG